ncbi:MAG: formin-like protein 18-like [Candidatus Peregrinibacteria bacterium Greene0416_62]|nr:MAG: formin-like protein 18-like [Candidatus Peregrinibacteria bacterium Greene0416_62]
MPPEQPSPESRPQEETTPEIEPMPNADPKAAMESRVHEMDKNLGTVQSVMATPTIAEEKQETPEEKQKREEQQIAQELTTRYEQISTSIKIRMKGAIGNIAEAEKTMKQQWFFQRWGSNEKSGIVESQKYHDQMGQLLASLGKQYENAKDFPSRYALLIRLRALVATNENGTPLRDSKGEYVSELFKAHPDFEKLRKEFQRTEQITNITEQGLQYAQTVLEMAASYAGPPGIAAALIPKYIVELTTGQSNYQDIAFRVVEDVASAYIGGGKFMKALLPKLGPIGKAVQKIFEANSKQGWTTAGIKKAVIEFIDMFKDQQVQHIFAELKEMATGQEAHKVTLEEMAAGRAMGKIIGKGLDKSGVKAKVEGVARGKNSRMENLGKDGRRKKLAPDEEKARDANLRLPETPDGRTVRQQKALDALNRTEPLSKEQDAAVLSAHDVPMTGVAPDGQPTYSTADLRQKMDTLEQGGFTRDEADTLLRMGVCGVPPPPPPPNRPNVPPPAPSAAPTPVNVIKPTPAVRPPPPPGYVPKPTPSVVPAQVTVLRPAPALPPRPGPAPSAAPATSNAPAQRPNVVKQNLTAPDATQKKTVEAPDAKPRLQTKSLEKPKAPNTTTSAQNSAEKTSNKAVRDFRVEHQKRESQLITLQTEDRQISQERNALSTEKEKLKGKIFGFKKNRIQEIEARDQELMKRSGEIRQEKGRLEWLNRASPVIEEYYSLTDKPQELYKWTAQYGHLTPEQAKMDPYLQQKLIQLRNESAFTFSSYLHVEHNNDGKGYQAYDPNRFKGENVNMRYDIANGYRRQQGVDLKSPYREHLVLAPLCPDSKTISKDQWTLTYIYVDKDYKGGSPMRDAIKDPRRRGIDPKDTHESKSALQNIPHDQKMASIMEHAHVDFDRLNHLVVSVTMDEKQARAMSRYFAENPSMIRPFFLNGMQGMEYTHKPPPYQTTDALPDLGIQFKEFNTTVGNDQRLGLQEERVLR